MRENHFVITLSPELVVTKEEGQLRRNADGTQFISVITDKWLPNEGEVLYITFSREDSDTEQNVKVGPLQLFYNVEKHRHITCVPPDLIRFAGQWDYSLELRFNIIEDEDGDIKYDCLPSSVETLLVLDSIAEATKTDTYVKETELISAAKTIAAALITGHTAEAVLDAASKAEASMNSALESAQSAENSASAAERDRQEAEYQAAKAEESARQALVAEEAAVKEAHAASSMASKAETEAEKAVASAVEALSSAEGAKEFAEIARKYASFGIGFNTDYTSVSELPIPGDPHYFYLVPIDGDGDNGYDEYVWLEDKQSYGKIGTTQIDLTSYLLKTEAAETYVTKEDFSYIKDWYDETHYQAPTVTLSLLPSGITASVDMTSDNLTRTLTGFTHKETHIDNISGDLTFSYGETEVGVAKSDTTATVNLDTAITVTFSSTGTRTATFTLKGINSRGVEFGATAQITSYYPAFYGALEEKPTDLSVLAKTTSSSISGTRSVEIEDDAKYIWFCTTGSINNIVSDTFPVPFELDSTLSYKGATYKLYRTSNKIVAGTHTFTIS